MENKNIKNTKEKVKFSIGYNQQGDFVDKVLIPFKNNISEVYFPISNKLATSGRVKEQGLDYNEEIKNLISKCEELNIGTNLLLNSLVESELAYQDRQKYFDDLNEEIKILYNLGLKSITVTNPVYIVPIKNKFSDIKIQTSINSFIDSIEKAEYFKNLGADILILDRDVNFDLKLIKKIKEKVGLPIKLLLNEGCLYKCPYRMFHFIEIGNKRDTGIYTKYCLSEVNKDPKKLVESQFIIPDNLKYYKEIVDYYKLGTRCFSSDRIAKLLSVYIEEKFIGNVYELLTTYPNREDKFFVPNEKLKYEIVDDKIKLIDFYVKKKQKIENLIVEINSICNNNCVYCYIPKDLRQDDKNMQLNYLKNKILNYKYVKNIDFTGGEPTLSKYLIHLVKYAKSLQISNRTLVTNGRLLSVKKNLDKLIDAGINRVVITLDCDDSHVADKMSQVKNSYNQVLCAVENLKDKNIEFGLTMVITNFNYKRISQTIKLMLDLGASFVGIQYLLPYVDDNKVPCKKNNLNIIPTYEETLPYLNKALEDNNYNSKIRVHFIPLCLLDDYPRVKDFVEYELDKVNRLVVNYMGFEYNMGEHLLKGAVKTNKCKFCSYKDSCVGFFKEYAKELGTLNLVKK